MNEYGGIISEKVQLVFEYFTECIGNTYGDKCSMACNCTSGHTINENQSCNRTTGECLCNELWIGTRCEIDVDECEVTPDICGENGDCNNTIGGHECVCHAGYTLDDQGNCTVGK